MGSSPAPEIKVKLTGEDTGVSAAIKELSTQLQQLKRTQDDASTSASRLGAAERGAGSSMREAREGARLLSEETGVHLNRGLVSVISRSATLGPLISAAFPVAAAIGFGEVIASAAEKLSTLIADTFIYTDAMKSQLAAQVAANNEIAKSNEKIKELKKAYELIGLSGSARETILATRAKEDVDAAIKELERLKAKQIEIEDPGWMKKALGVGLDFIGLDTGIGQPDVDAARATKETQVTAQEKKRDELIEEQRAADKELADQKAEEDKAAAAKAKTLQDQINKARLAQIEAGFAGELELYKAQHSLLDQDNEANYVKGLESTAQYYAKKQQLAAESSQKEIDALTAERARVLAAPTKDGAEQIEQQTKAADLANKIAIAQCERREGSAATRERGSAKTGRGKPQSPRFPGEDRRGPGTQVRRGEGEDRGRSGGDGRGTSESGDRSGSNRRNGRTVQIGGDSASTILEHEDDRTGRGRELHRSRRGHPAQKYLDRRRYEDQRARTNADPYPPADRRTDESGRDHSRADQRRRRLREVRRPDRSRREKLEREHAKFRAERDATRSKATSRLSSARRSTKRRESATRSDSSPARSSARSRRSSPRSSSRSSRKSSSRLSLIRIRERPESRPRPRKEPRRPLP